MSKTILSSIILIVLVLGAGAFIYKKANNTNTIKVDLPLAREYKDFSLDNDSINIKKDFEPSVENTNQSEKEKSNTNITESNDVNDVEESNDEAVAKNINLDVPFTSQAPTANWEQPFQDACEEAAVLMADYYLKGKKMPNPEEVENILIDMVAWQNINMDGDIDMNIEEVAYFAENYLGYSEYEIIEDLSAEKIRYYLNRGLPVIVPANGKKLNNPYFRNGGPDYHMFTIKGYVGANFIVNDPGTSRGYNFVYTEENLMEAIADWNQKQHQASGPKRALVLF